MNSDLLDFSYDFESKNKIKDLTKQVNKSINE